MQIVFLFFLLFLFGCRSLPFSFLLLSIHLLDRYFTCHGRYINEIPIRLRHCLTSHRQWTSMKVHLSANVTSTTYTYESLKRSFRRNQGPALATRQNDAKINLIKIRKKKKKKKKKGRQHVPFMTGV